MTVCRTGLYPKLKLIYTLYMAEEHSPHPWISERLKINPRFSGNARAKFNNRMAVFVTRKFGTMGTFYILTLWMFGWMLLATLGFGAFRNDQYPFTFLLFLSNLVQLLALPILAVGQQILNQSSERQAEQTYKDAEAILKLQDEVHRLVKINNKLTEEIHFTVHQKNNSH